MKYLTPCIALAPKCCRTHPNIKFLNFTLVINRLHKYFIDICVFESNLVSFGVYKSIYFVYIKMCWLHCNTKLMQIVQHTCSTCRF